MARRSTAPGSRADAAWQDARRSRPTEATDLLEQARKGFSRKRYEEAIPLLTRLLEQPEFPQRAEAQELMGLARERNRSWHMPRPSTRSTCAATRMARP